MNDNFTAILHLNPFDNIAIAKQDLAPGDLITLPGSGLMQIQVKQSIPAGHKVALETIEIGQPVLRYGVQIGVAAQQISAGDHVHTHNLQAAVYDQDYVLKQPVSLVEIADGKGELISAELPEQQRHFLGFLRSDGRIGTRNFIAVIASVQCAAQVCKQIANKFTPALLSEYPNVDGVIALTHIGGCGQSDYQLLRRTLTAMANHPNIAAALLVGLGCEGNNLAEFNKSRGRMELDLFDQPKGLEIQALGGSRKTIQAGIAAVEAMLPEANKSRRSPQPISKLTLALECGGSDSWSGITANPLVGQLADLVVNQGGTVVMAETPEVFGAEHLLLNRAANPQVAQRLIEKLAWWRDYVIRIGASLEDNPSPGNKAGGLTNICEKSLGAIVKSGSTALQAVVNYAEKIENRGFVFMDSPGNDPISVTGMVAGGCNLVLFTTGRGSVFGFKPAPCLKISTNSTTYQRMVEDMDFNAGRIIEEDIDLETAAKELLDKVIAVASGERTKSERLGLGEMEFVPWFQEGFI